MSTVQGQERVILSDKQTVKTKLDGMYSSINMIVCITMLTTLFITASSTLTSIAVCICLWICYFKASKWNRFTIKRDCQNQCMQVYTSPSTHLPCVLIFYSALIGISEAQSSTQAPISTSHNLRSNVAVLTVLGFLLLCVFGGVLLYCICRLSQKRRTLLSTEAIILYRMTRQQMNLYHF